MITGDPIYTLRQAEKAGTYYLCKWDLLEVEPLDIYYMKDDSHYCGCPSPKRPCKHWPIKEALQADGRNLWTIGYEEGKIISLPGLDRDLISGYLNNRP